MGRTEAHRPAGGALLTPPVSATEIAGRIDWLALSPEAQDTLRRIVVYVWAGYERDEIAKALGISPATVGSRLAKVRAEIRAQLAERPP